jgi:hypothetical protein
VLKSERVCADAREKARACAALLQSYAYSRSDAVDQCHQLFALILAHKCMALEHYAHKLTELLRCCATALLLLSLPLLLLLPLPAATDTRARRQASSTAGAAHNECH